MIKLVLVSTFLVGGTVAAGLGLSFWHGAAGSGGPSRLTASALPVVTRDTREERGAALAPVSLRPVRPDIAPRDTVRAPEGAARPPSILPEDEPAQAPVLTAPLAASERRAPHSARQTQAQAAPERQNARQIAVQPQSKGRTVAEIRPPEPALPLPQMSATPEPDYFIGVYR